jgi:hypothetical protein
VIGNRSREASLANWPRRLKKLDEHAPMHRMTALVHATGMAQPLFLPPFAPDYAADCTCCHRGLPEMF